MKLTFPPLLLLGAMSTALAAPAHSPTLPAPPLAAASTPMQTSPHLFLGLHDFSTWTRSPGAKPGEIALTSPVLDAPAGWNQLIASWNATLPATATLRLEARGLYAADAQNAAHQTKFYDLGHWSGDPKIHPRQSVTEQADADGDVETDTLVMKRQGAHLQLRLTLGDDAPTGAAPLVPMLHFVGLSLLDSTQKVAPRQANRAAWGRIVAVPERFQMDYRDQGGAVWCSPTSVSMILEHWSQLEQRPELNLTVPQVAAAVYDPKWEKGGTGNWSFNAAFAGSFPGVRAYATRFSDLRDLETWIAAGVPVVLSVNYGLLKGPGQKGGGHLVVCNGFTPSGDVVIADPGQHTEAGQHFRTFPRADVIAGWGASHNTVYLITPEPFAPPAASPNWDTSAG